MRLLLLLLTLLVGGCATPHFITGDALTCAEGGEYRESASGVTVSCAKDLRWTGPMSDNAANVSPLDPQGSDGRGEPGAVKRSIAQRAVESYGCLAPLMILLHEERTVTLSPAQRRHLVNLCRTNARKNRALSKERRAAGDVRGDGFYAGQALAYRRMAQRIDWLEGAYAAEQQRAFGLNPEPRPI